MTNSGKTGGERRDLRGRLETGSRSARRKRRLSPGLAAISSAVILSVYAAGYLHTQSAASQIAAQTGATAEAAQPVAVFPSVQPVPPTAPTAAQPAAYRDGTYTGRGSSRHGDIEATVLIKGGRIVSAAVTQCRTRYSCSEVDALRAEVIARQGPPVDHISGATDSSTAYRGAITQALSQAAA